MQFIIERLRRRETRQSAVGGGTPLFVGINGAQGAGKSTLVCNDFRSHLAFITHLAEVIVITKSELGICHSTINRGLQGLLVT